MNKPLFLFIGRSASGKTTIANMLADKYGYKQIWSYTTRPPRYENEPGHIFVSEEEFYSLGELAAYTLYNGNHYGTTFEQLNECDIYVVDIPGLKSLLHKLKDNNRQIYIFYFDASVHNRILRMIDRHDSDMMIISRLLEDEKEDWLKKLNSIVWHNSKVLKKNIELYKIDANNDENIVMELVLYYMQLHKED